VKKNYFTIFTGSLLAVLLGMYLIAYQVGEYEKVVLTTFGKPTKSICKPGLYFKYPWPVQKIYIYDSRLITDEGVFEETYTGDGKNLIFSTCIGWRIDDPLKFLESIGNIDDAKRNLEGLVRTYKNGVLGNHSFANIISTKRDDLQFLEIEDEIKKPVADEAIAKYGIKVEFIYITRVGLPEQTTAKVFERMKKERERIAEQYRSEGEAKANEIKAVAISEHDQILAKANAEAKRIRGEGDASAAQYYNKFDRNKDLAVFLKKLETLEEVLKNKSTVILNTQTAPFDLLNSKPEDKQNHGN